jgi:hypothetical protein
MIDDRSVQCVIDHHKPCILLFAVTKHNAVNKHAVGAANMLVEDLLVCLLAVGQLLSQALLQASTAVLVPST